MVSRTGVSFYLMMDIRFQRTTKNRFFLVSGIRSPEIFLVLFWYDDVI